MGICLNQSLVHGHLTHFEYTLHLIRLQNRSTGFPKKDARFSNMKNMPDLLSDKREGKTIEIPTLNI